MHSPSQTNVPRLCGSDINTVTHLENRQRDGVLKGTMTKSSTSKGRGEESENKKQLQHLSAGLFVDICKYTSFLGYMLQVL